MGVGSPGAGGALQEVVRALTIGQPDFNTPEHVKQGVMAALARNETKYPPIDGIPELREAAARKFQRENALKYNADQIMVGTGSKQIIFNAMLATIGPGDEAIIPAPYWISYLDMVLVADGTPVEVPCSAESGFKLTHVNFARVSYLSFACAEPAIQPALTCC